MKKLLLVGIAVSFYALAQAQSGPTNTDAAPTVDSATPSSMTDQQRMEANEDLTIEERKQKMERSTEGSAIDEGVDTMDSKDSMDSATPSTVPDAPNP